jgi:hypothetical protein
MAAALTGNGGHGFDHYCSKDETHALWHPTEWRTGKACPLAICSGVLVPTGRGSRAASAA